MVLLVMSFIAGLIVFDYYTNNKEKIQAKIQSFIQDKSEEVIDDVLNKISSKNT